MDPKPTQVPPTVARQVGHVRARWGWTEPSVWTERMLTVLEQGVKGGVWFTEQKRWPNAFFTKEGLYSLRAAHAGGSQSS